MIDKFGKSDLPELGGMPSARSQDGVPVKSPRRPVRKRRIRGTLLRIAAALVAIVVLVAGGLAVLLSRGPISHEQLRSQVEATLSNLAGENYKASLGDAQIALGKLGLLALSAKDLSFAGRADRLALGSVEEAFLHLRAIPLVRGDIVADSLVLKNVRLSLAQMLGEAGPPTPVDEWIKAADLAGTMVALRQSLDRLLTGLRESGLQSIVLENVTIEGFERLGLLSRTAVIPLLKVERNVNFRTGMRIAGEIATDRSSWPFRGSWEERDTEGMALKLWFDGLDTDEIAQPVEGDDETVGIRAPLTISLEAPFNAKGAPEEATARIGLGTGEIALSVPERTKLRQAQLNFRLMPEKNQIELDASPVRFDQTTATLLGGVRFPAHLEEGAKPLFEIIANDVQAKGLVSGGDPVSGALQINGVIDANGSSLMAEQILLKTAEGNLEGKGRLTLSGTSPGLKLDLAISEMKVDSFKQFWPPFLAPGARRWVRTGLEGGTIRNARAKVDIPPGILGNMKHGKKLAPDHLVAVIPVFGTSIKTTGDIPRIENAEGIVTYRGMKTSVDVKTGKVSLPGNGTIDVGASTVDIGDFAEMPLLAQLNLDLRGDAASLATLGALQPLTYTKSLGLNSGDLSGGVSADVTLSLPLVKDLRVEEVDWKARLTLKDVSSTSKILDRSIGNANLKIEAEPGVARIEGTATLDGVPVKLALVEPFGDGVGVRSERNITSVLDDEMRKKLGLDTSGILSGPVSIDVEQGPDDSQKITANLTDAILSLPWVGWSKGKGIKGSASFILTRSGDTIRISDFVLEGAGFGARGNLVLDGDGLQSADLKRVILNKNDRLDLKVARKKSGYDIALSGRSYDARGIINRVLDEGRTAQGKKGTGYLRIRGEVETLRGFNGQVLSTVTLDYAEDNGQIRKAELRGLAEGVAPTRFSFAPKGKTMQAELATNNAGAVLQFLDFYSKIQGGGLTASLKQDRAGVYRGVISANDFVVLDEPRLQSLLAAPGRTDIGGKGEDPFRKVEKAVEQGARVKRFAARVEKGKGFLRLSKGRLRGGDVAATFDGTVYDRRGRMKIKGTFLPAYGLNKLVSKIPVIGLAFGRGKVNGLVGITFRLRGSYKKPQIIVNPVSLFAPGVFRKIFEL